MDITICLLFRGGLTLAEALEIAYAYEENDITDIYITPPAPHVLSDEDSGDEMEVNPDNFSGNQLSAEAEIKFKNQNSQETSPGRTSKSNQNAGIEYERCDVNIQ